MTREISGAYRANARIAGAFLRTAKRHTAFPAPSAGTKAGFSRVRQEGIPGLARTFSSFTVVDAHGQTDAFFPAAEKSTTGQILISNVPYVQCSFSTNIR